MTAFNTFESIPSSPLLCLGIIQNTGRGDIASVILEAFAVLPTVGASLLATRSLGFVSLPQPLRGKSPRKSLACRLRGPPSRSASKFMAFPLPPALLTRTVHAAELETHPSAALLRIYAWMQLARTSDNRILELFRQGLIRGTVTGGQGNEVSSSPSPSSPTRPPTSFLSLTVASAVTSSGAAISAIISTSISPTPPAPPRAAKGTFTTATPQLAHSR